MSIKFMEAAFQAPVGNMGERVVLVALADYANDSGQCWPGLETLAHKCACTARALKNIIKRLIAKGLLQLTHRHRRSSQFRVNLVPSRVSPAPLKGNLVPAKGNLVPVLGERSSPRTVKDPSLNLRDAKSVFTETEEERELRFESYRRGFRSRMPYESAEMYRNAMNRLKIVTTTQCAATEADDDEDTEF